MKEKKNIVLVLRMGGRYGIADVMLILRNIHLTTENVNVYCLTDVFTEETRLNHVTFLPLKHNYPGWWSKMELFAPELENLRPFLFLDLDTVVNGSVEPVFPPYNQLFYSLEDFYRPGGLASGMMFIPRENEKVKKIWDNWITFPNDHMKRFRGDQDFIQETIGKPDHFFSDEMVTTFKPAGKLRTTRPIQPVVCFHGQPTIWKAAETIEWIANYIRK